MQKNFCILLQINHETPMGKTYNSLTKETELTMITKQISEESVIKFIPENKMDYYEIGQITMACSHFSATGPNDEPIAVIPISDIFDAIINQN